MSGNYLVLLVVYIKNKTIDGCMVGREQMLLSAYFYGHLQIMLDCLVISPFIFTYFQAEPSLLTL